MSVRGSNWWKDIPSIIGNKRTAVLENVRRAANSKYSPLGDLADSFKSLRPVYKVMITMPHIERVGINVVKSYRYILADTSRPYVNFLNKSDSPIIGMWIDQSDLIEPDKAIILIHNPMSHESGTFESDILRFPQFGVRNWLDIWMGYAPITPGRSLMNLDQVIDKIDMASLKIPGLDKVAFTYPDPFFFGNESHVFSGPIVSIKREVKPTGDKLQIIGFSPIILYRGMRSKKFGLSKGIKLNDAITTIATSMDIFPDSKQLSSSFDRDDKLFYNGRFTWNMIGFDDYRINTAFQRTEGRALKISPIIFNDSKIATRGQAKYPFSNPLKDHDSIMDKLEDIKFALRSDIKPSNKNTLYDILFRKLVDPTLTGLYGLHAFVRPTPTDSNDAMWAFRDGIGHPGVHIKYGFKFEINGIIHQINGNESNNFEKRYGSEMQQEITLGRTAREFEVGIEYGTVFNTRQFMVKTGEDAKTEALICPTGSYFTQKISKESSSFDEHSKFWDALYDDISVYGETMSPIMTWLWGEGDQSIDFESGDIAGAIAQKMRESYFAGMGGTVFAVGNSSFKPGRVLDIKDQRTNLSEDMKAKTEAMLRSNVAKLSNIRTIPASPVALRLKGVDKMFYIWKVRHYLGVNSGFITKIWFIEERNRAWQQHTEQISNIIGAALAQAKQLMGVT